ncbi:hypothetical protein NDA01_14080 [Trichocoleus desertorum AS-A10]|uniref:hypothetical protein n=1 Tax=Trichocoleus desertorum TaxID=1481672 RepID=UPI0032989DAD
MSLRGVDPITFEAETHPLIYRLELHLPRSRCKNLYAGEPDGLSFNGVLDTLLGVADI